MLGGAPVPSTSSQITDMYCYHSLIYQGVPDARQSQPGVESYYRPEDFPAARSGLLPPGELRPPPPWQQQQQQPDAAYTSTSSPAMYDETIR